MKKLAIVISHPIQYYSKIFEILNKQCLLKVFYTSGNPDDLSYDVGFGKAIKWDIPLLDGYDYTFVSNSAKKPGYNHFSGIKNTDLIEQISFFNPSAILVYGWAYHSHLKVMRYFKGKIPILFRGDSTLLDDQLWIKNLFRSFLLTWVYKHVDFAFYVGKANKAYFKAMGVPEQKLIYAPHAVDNDRFGQDRKEEVRALRDQLAINEDEILILFAGKFEEKKDPLILLEAFIHLNHSNTHLLFVGNGELEEKLKRTALLQTQGDNSKKKIHFLDFQNQNMMPVIYQVCDLFCLPSRGPSETWGLAVNEAMAAGKAILVSNRVGSAEDLVLDHRNGYIFKHNDLNDCIDKLQKLIANKSALINMGIFSGQMIKGWNFENITKALMSQMRKINEE